MKNIRKQITLIFVTAFLAFTIYGQENILQKSIYFETAKYDLTTDSKTILDNLADSLKGFQNYDIIVKGNTDNVGATDYNKNLSQQRVLATQKYFVSKGISPSIFSTSALGEEKPIADNLTGEGRQKNRRVDVIIHYTRQMPTDTSQYLPSILELYKKTKRKPQEFCINPERDTVLRCKEGSIIFIKANSFNIPDSNKSNCITVKIKEDFLTSDMILDNLSTTSDGQIIETQGMIYTEVSNYKGNNIGLANGKELTIFIPTDTIRQDAKIFQGNRMEHTGLLNWTLDNNSALEDFTLSDLDVCSDFLNSGKDKIDEKECKFFFCKIRHFFQKVFGRTPSGGIDNPQISGELMDKCAELQALYNKYGVSNPRRLTTALNQALMDSLGVKTMTELHDTLQKINKKKVELSYMNKSISYDDFKYYVFNTSELGWKNVDCFANINPNRKVKMKINLEAAKNIDCKLVFKSRRYIVAPSIYDYKYEFDGVPKGDKAWVIAIKYDGKKPYLSIQETTVGEKTVDVDFKVLTLEELKDKLKVLDQ